MNSLISSSWKRDSSSPNGSVHVEPEQSFDLEKFFEEVESVKAELAEMELSHRSLAQSNESLKTQHSSSAVHRIRSQMDGDVSTALAKAKLVKLKLDSLDRSNSSSRSIQGCGPGSSTDRTRTSVVSGLRAKLRDQMDAFGDLRRRIAADHRDVVARRYYAVTGEKADEGTVEAMAAGDREMERILRAAVEGKGAVEAAIAEMKERRGAAEEVERSLVELHQIFLDMAVLVDSQGHQIDDIESQVGRASSFIVQGVRQLHRARSHQKNTRKWAFAALIILLVLILVIVLPIVLRNT